MHHTRASNAIVNQSDVNGKFSVSTDELLCRRAVDQPISAPPASFVVADRFTLQTKLQAFAFRKRINQLMRLIRFRERRRIVFVATSTGTAFIYLHDLLPLRKRFAWSAAVLNISSESPVSPLCQAVSSGWQRNRMLHQVFKNCQACHITHHQPLQQDLSGLSLAH